MEVARALDLWLAWMVGQGAWSPKHHRKVLSLVDRAKGAWGFRRIAGLGVGDLGLFEQAALQARGNRARGRLSATTGCAGPGTRSAAALNFDRTYLSNFFAFARRQKWIPVDADPMADWRWRREPVHPERYTFYTPEERRRLAAEIRDDLKVWLLLAAVTGLRESSVRLLRWKWISRTGVLCVPEGAVKNRVPIRQALPEEVVRALGPRGRPEDLVLPGLPEHPQTVWREFQKACRRANVPVGMPHDLRRSFANALMANGVSEGVIMTLGGWTDPRTMRRYYVGPVPDATSRAVLEKLV